MHSNTHSGLARRQRRVVATSSQHSRWPQTCRVRKEEHLFKGRLQFGHCLEKVHGIGQRQNDAMWKKTSKAKRWSVGNKPNLTGYNSCAVRESEAKLTPRKADGPSQHIFFDFDDPHHGRRMENCLLIETDWCELNPGAMFHDRHRRC